MIQRTSDGRAGYKEIAFEEKAPGCDGEIVAINPSARKKKVVQVGI